MVIACELAELEERGAVVEYGVYSVPGQQLVSFLGEGLVLIADIHDLACNLVQLFIALLHCCVIIEVRLCALVHLSIEHLHEAAV